MVKNALDAITEILLKLDPNEEGEKLAAEHIRTLLADRKFTEMAKILELSEEKKNDRSSNT